jgi:para-aminobenzoate synthetase component 1
MRARAHIVEEIRHEGTLARVLAAFERRDSFLLDGGAHTLLGAEPFATLRVYRTHRTDSGRMAARVVVRRGDDVTEHDTTDPLDVVRGMLREHAIDPAIYDRRPIPLLAGAVGYIGYEIGQTLERLPCRPRVRSGMPDIALSFHDWIIGRDEGGRTYLSVVGETRASAEALRDRIRGRITDHDHDHDHNHWRQHDHVMLGEHTPRREYLARVRKAKEHICSGDAFEICLTHAIDAAFDSDPRALFQALRTINPAPYAALLELPEGAVVSSSPERFLSLDARRIAESRPIKGTRPRGATDDEDARLARDLATAEKDRAENAMIVDLVRNDLGKVCRFGSVSVPELYAVEPYATVHQLVSTIRGELLPERDAIDLVRACFPPGSMTGAPKIEAMTILERLEPTERGPYSGALGWFDFSGTLDLSVVIRAIIVRDGRARLHTGGAIVADSDPAAEHDETLHKARALIAALGAS